MHIQTLKDKRTDNFDKNTQNVWHRIVQLRNFKEAWTITLESFSLDECICLISEW